MKENEKNRAQLRELELVKQATPYLESRPDIERGLELTSLIRERQAYLRRALKVSRKQWNDWRWQMQARIQDPRLLAELISVDDEVSEVAAMYRVGISPYYLSLLNPNPEASCPLRRMVIPSSNELQDGGLDDPMSERETSPAPCITRRYPDRLIINVTNKCGSFCRFCQRRRNIGQRDLLAKKADLQAAFDYVASHSEIRDVLVTGGDPLTLADEELEWVIRQLRRISHVEVIRIGTRMLATIPQRVTPGLSRMLKRYHPLYINTHFNHPLEITKEAKLACERLADVGINLGNQAVLLRGVNNSTHVMQVLSHELLKVRVKPYYLFHPKLVRGTLHFYCSINEGLTIMEGLRGRTSGMAIPTYIVNAPGGLGKIPLLPEYIIEQSDGKVRLRTWEGREVELQEPRLPCLQRS